MITLNKLGLNKWHKLLLLLQTSIQILENANFFNTCDSLNHGEKWTQKNMNDY